MAFSHLWGRQEMCISAQLEAFFQGVLRNLNQGLSLQETNSPLAPNFSLPFSQHEIPEQALSSLFPDLIDKGRTLHLYSTLRLAKLVSRAWGRVVFIFSRFRRQSSDWCHWLCSDNWC